MKTLSIFILAILPLFSNAQFDNEPNLIRVQGEFITKQKPENMIVSLSIEESDKEYQKCFDRTFETLKKLKAAFIDNGISEEAIKTKDFSIHEDYTWENNKKIKTEYESMINMEIEEKYTEEFASKLLKSLREYSFEVNYSIKFILSENQKETLRELAIKESMKDALKKAEIIAKSSNIELGNIYKISYGNSWGDGMDPIDYDLVQEQGFDYLLYAKVHKEVGFNPKEIGIKKIIMVEWEIKE